MTEGSRRRVQRVRLSQPLVGRVGTLQVILIDISLRGARIEHASPLQKDTSTRIIFPWGNQTITAECRVVRSRLERFSTGPDGLTAYHSGLEFTHITRETRAALKEMLEHFISRALEEQKLNARGAIPPTVENMPIFRFGGQLTANPSDVTHSHGGNSSLPISRLARETGYICYSLDNRQWRMKRTNDPGQPPVGFTISATEDVSQAKLLCEAYEKSDETGRKMIQLFAQLSIAEGEGISPGRFEP
jgi:hypothetical protein